MQRRVVERGPALGEIVDEQVAHRSALEPVAVDEGRTAQLALGPQRPCRRRPVGEHARTAQELIEVRARRVGAELDVLGDAEQLQAVADGDVGDGATLGGDNGRDSAQREAHRVGIDEAVLRRRPRARRTR